MYLINLYIDIARYRLKHALPPPTTPYHPTMTAACTIIIYINIYIYMHHAVIMTFVITCIMTFIMTCDVARRAP